MKIEDLYKLYIKHGLVDTDTRSIRKNAIFFALKGDNFNGNKFAKQAIDNGAKFAVIDEKEYEISDRFILVDNVIETLQKLANFHRNQLNIPIIALTGSNGKTTTKELINAVLSSQYKTTATKGNLNNHIGVPLTLLSMTTATEIGIVEMGANHHKEIAFLSEIANPDFGYITNFGSAHLEGFGSLEGVIKAKSELYDFIKKNNKKVFVNQSDATQVEKTKDCNVIAFDDSIEFVEANPFVKLLFKNTEITTNLIGDYNYNNLAAAITIGNYFKISISKIKIALEGYVPSNNRSQIINTKNNKIILDAYNANPTSMKAALESFKLLKASHKTVILGDMFELGKYSEQEHQNIVDILNTSNFDKVLLLGENFYKTSTKYPRFSNYSDLRKHLLDDQILNTTILIKGSRGVALERVVELC